MKTILLKNAGAVLPGGKRESVSLLIENGLIAEISLENETYPADESLDLENTSLCAGFIDVHNHGAVGIDVNRATAENFIEVGRFLASCGVTAWVPTFVPDADETYRKVTAEMEKARSLAGAAASAQILGVHYEGVFANEKMCGALRPRFFKKFESVDAIKSLPTLDDGIRMTTLAPEIENGIALIEELTRQNWVVSIGHTRADVETLDRALDAGARHLTHFFNAMTGIHHRDLGVAGWALSRDETTFDIIADGIHVHPEMLRLACRAKTPGRVSLISDSVAPTGLGDGDFEIWDEKITVEGGRTRNERGSIAGSVITMLDACKMMRSQGFSETEVSQMASACPARLLGLEKTLGTIETGKRADLVALDRNGDVRHVFVGGKAVR